jgi:hypothetical protein
MNSIWKTGPISLGLGWAEVVFGGWLIISPFVLGFAHDKVGLLNNIISGILLILFTLASSRNGLMRIFIILEAGWLYASAFGWASTVSKEIYLWNDLIVAVLVIFACVASETPYPPGYRAKE